MSMWKWRCKVTTSTVYTSTFIDLLSPYTTSASLLVLDDANPLWWRTRHAWDYIMLFGNESLVALTLTLYSFFLSTQVLRHIAHEGELGGASYYVRGTTLSCSSTMLGYPHYRVLHEC